MSYIFED